MSPTHGTAAQVERLVRAWRRCDRVEEARQTERAHLNRSVTMYVDEDGMVVMRARLTPELGAVVQRALEAASERLYQESRHAAAPESVAEEVTAGQRRADAFGLLAECALANMDRGPGRRSLSGGAAHRERRRRRLGRTGGVGTG